MHWASTTPMQSKPSLRDWKTVCFLCGSVFYFITKMHKIRGCLEYSWPPRTYHLILMSCESISDAQREGKRSPRKKQWRLNMAIPGKYRRPRSGPCGCGEGGKCGWNGEGCYTNGWFWRQVLMHVAADLLFLQVDRNLVINQEKLSKPLREVLLIDFLKAKQLWGQGISMTENVK